MPHSGSDASIHAIDPLEFEKLITDLSVQFVEVDSTRIDACLQGALRSVVEALDLERSSLTEFTHDGTMLQVLSSWAVEGIEPAPTFIVSDELPWASDRLRNGRPIRFSDPDDLPPEASKIKDWFCSQGVRSHVTVPMSVGPRVLGGFHVASMRRRIDWEPWLPRLSTLARIFAGAIERRRIDGELRQTLAELEQLKERVTEENLYLRQELETRERSHDVVGNSPPIQQSLERAAKVAGTDSAVLLLGETGTGKGLFAEAIHRQSRRVDKPLIQIDCTALPPTLIESELFGHEKGAFSGATQSKRGRLELAHEGTLFLDEIGELPEELQVKFLHVLETGRVSRLGSTKTATVDVRVVVATNRDLQAEVAAGRFRADLYYRISVFPIVLPALRERVDDIPLLTWYFVDQLQSKFGRRIREIPSATMEDLQAYSWPGNVRELRNVIERSLILTSGDTLVVDEPFVGAGPPSGPEQADDLDTQQRTHIVRVLEACGGRIKGPGGAAQRLGLKPSTLYYRLKRLGIDR
jgi:transcriptional regulator with GAF, ATPase, and Fis domain